MGLFKKKPKTTEPAGQPADASAGAPSAPRPQPTPPRTRSRRGDIEIDALRAEVFELRARLEATEQAKALVEARLAALDATTTAIASNRLGGDDLRARINDLEGQVQGVATAAAAAASAAEAAAVKATSAASVAAVPHHTSADPIIVARLDALTARIDALPAAGPDPDVLARLEALAVRVELADALEAQLNTLQQRFDELQGQPASADASAITNSLAAQLAQLAERISASDIAARHAAEQVATLDQRLAAVSTELANQLRELGNDIDGLAAHQDDAAAGVISDEVLDAIRSGQVKLAAEQARYEIAFRQDLAALAEQVRRGKA